MRVASPALVLRSEFQGGNPPVNSRGKNLPELFEGNTEEGRVGGIKYNQGIVDITHKKKKEGIGGRGG